MAPAERKAPDLDHTREALRAHDERMAEEQDEVPETPPADDGGDEVPEVPETPPADDGGDEVPETPPDDDSGDEQPETG